MAVRQGDGWIHCSSCNEHLPSSSYYESSLLNCRRQCKRCMVKARTRRRHRAAERSRVEIPHPRPAAPQSSAWSGLTNERHRIVVVQLDDATALPLTAAEAASLEAGANHHEWRPAIAQHLAPAATVEQLVENLAATSKCCGRVPPLYRRALEQALEESAKKRRKSANRKPAAEEGKSDTPVE